MKQHRKARAWNTAHSRHQIKVTVTIRSLPDLCCSSVLEHGREKQDGEFLFKSLYEESLLTLVPPQSLKTTYLRLEINWFKAPALKLHYCLELLIVISLERKYIEGQAQWALRRRPSPVPFALSTMWALPAPLSLE